MRHRVGCASRVLTARADASAAPLGQRQVGLGCRDDRHRGTVEGGRDRIDVVGRTKHEDRLGLAVVAIKQREHVVGRRIDTLGRHPVGVDQGNQCVVGFDDAHRNVAITATIGDAHRQRVGGLLLRNRDDVVQPPGRQRVEEGRGRGFGLICPGDADDVKAVFPTAAMTSSRVSKSTVSRQMVAPSAVVPSTSTHRTSADVIDRPSTRSTWFCPRSGSNRLRDYRPTRQHKNRHQILRGPGGLHRRLAVSTSPTTGCSRS